MCPHGPQIKRALFTARSNFLTRFINLIVFTFVFALLSATCLFVWDENPHSRASSACHYCIIGDDMLVIVELKSRLS